MASKKDAMLVAKCKTLKSNPGGTAHVESSNECTHLNGISTGVPSGGADGEGKGAVGTE